MTVDEDAGIIKLEDENGNKFVMDSSGITIESCKDFNIKARPITAWKLLMRR